MEFNDLTGDERTDLQDQIRGLAWAFARRAAGFAGASPYDRALLRLADRQRVAETADLTPGDRRTMYLARLRVLGIMQSELDSAADLEAYCAGAEGANFRELGDAWGISRAGRPQAVVLPPRRTRRRGPGSPHLRRRQRLRGYLGRHAGWSGAAPG